MGTAFSSQHEFYHPKSSPTDHTTATYRSTVIFPPPLFTNTTSSTRFTITNSPPATRREARAPLSDLRQSERSGRGRRPAGVVPPPQSVCQPVCRSVSRSVRPSVSRVTTVTGASPLSVPRHVCHRAIDAHSDRHGDMARFTELRHTRPSAMESVRFPPPPQQRLGGVRREEVQGALTAVTSPH